MLVASLGKHFPHRKMEWVLAGITSSWGLYTLLHPEMFTAPGSAAMFAGLAAMTPFSFMPNVLWGAAALVVGVVRAIALYINGAHVRTPIIRAICAFVTMFVFSQIAIGLWQTGIANTGIVVYPWLIAADMLSAYAAGKDAITAEAHRRIERGTINDDSRFSRALTRL